MDYCYFKYTRYKQLRILLASRSRNSSVWAKFLLFSLRMSILTLFFLFDVKGYTLTSCEAKGRIGPNKIQCTNAYQEGVTKVQVVSQNRLSGIQVWTVPTNGLYT